jgi:Holliday junction DNA helicase RuvA
MIGYLRGRLAFKQPPALLLEVAGVGYELEAPMSTFYTLPDTGAQIELFTHLVVREDAHVLFGFASEAERRLFRGLLKVSGVGPRVALGILSGISVEGFLGCVETQDVAALVRIPGVGRKTAERLVMEMRDRAAALLAPGSAPRPAGVAAGPQAEAFSALVTLGYKPAEVMRLLKNVAGEGHSTEETIRRALQAAVKE